MNDTRQAIATLMADGRERTINDIMRKVQTTRADLLPHMMWMVDRGVLKSDRHSGTGQTIYRAA